MVEGKLQKEGDVIHVIVRSCYNLSSLLATLTASQEEALPILTLARADEKTAPPVPDAERRKKLKAGDQIKMFPEGRNFR